LSATRTAAARLRVVGALACTISLSRFHRVVRLLAFEHAAGTSTSASTSTSGARQPDIRIEAGRFTRAGFHHNRILPPACPPDRPDHRLRAVRPNNIEGRLARRLPHHLPSDPPDSRLPNAASTRESPKRMRHLSQPLHFWIDEAYEPEPTSASKTGSSEGITPLQDKGPELTPAQLAALVRKNVELRRSRWSPHRGNSRYVPSILGRPCRS
jgi:hypothetical protein